MKPRKYTPSKRVRNHIAKWEASDFAGQNAAFGGDAVGAKAIELMDMLGDKANAFTDNELDGLLSTYYNLSPRGFRKTLMPYIDAYAADLSDVNKKGLDLAMRDRWRIAAKKYQRSIRRRANADADLMGLSYQDPIVEQPDVIKRTNIVVPEENTEATWKGAENISPYVTGKPIIKLQPRLKLPPIEEFMEDSEWEPSFRLNPRGYKNGKSPEVVITPDQEYNQYLNTLPDNQRLTPESLYRSHRYWELNGKPKSFAEAIGKGMFNYDTSDHGWHAKSVTFNENTGEYEFMKPNWHSTKMYEDAWYYSEDGEEFRKNYIKKPGVAYDKYIPRHADGKLPRYKDGDTPNIFRRPDNSYFFLDGDQQINVTPLMTSIGDDPSMWTYVDDSGKIYTPKLSTNQDTVVQDDRNAGLLFWDRYIGELKYDIDNNRVIGGKYTMPAIALGALGTYMAGAAGAAPVTLLQAANLVGKNIYGDAARNFALSMLGGETLNEATKMFTGASWGLNINSLSGNWIPETVADFTNPGYLLSGESATSLVDGFKSFVNQVPNYIKYALKQINAPSRMRNLARRMEDYYTNLHTLTGKQKDAANKELPELLILAEEASNQYKKLVDNYQNALRGVIRKKEHEGYEGAESAVQKLINHYKLNPGVEQIMSAKGGFGNKVKLSKNARRFEQITDNNFEVLPDFSKMSAHDIVRFINKYASNFRFNKDGERALLRLADATEDAEGLKNILAYSGFKIAPGGMLEETDNLIPFDLIFKTGDFSVPIFGTNDAVMGMIDVTNPGTRQLTNYVDLIRSISDKKIDPRKVVFSNTGYSASVPQAYQNALKKNIDYLTNRFPGSKAFGSSTTSAYAGTPHATHDIDLLISDTDFINSAEKEFGNRTSNGWRVSSRPNGSGYEDTYTHSLGSQYGDAGDIDFNIIYTDPNTGMASSTMGTRALELYKQFFPAEYKLAVMQSMKTGLPIVINKTPKELIDAYDPVVKTIADSFSSSKPKHVPRAEAHLTTTDPQYVLRALDLYAQEKLGGSALRLPISKEMFTDVEQNRRIFKELGYKGVDEETVVNDPAKMKNLMDYWYIHNSIFGRGVDTYALDTSLSSTELALDNAFRLWKGLGGNINGAGLNTVTLGDSNYGNVYGYILPKLKFETGQDAELILHSAKRQLGHYSYLFTSQDKKEIQEIINNAGQHVDMSSIDTPAQLLDRLPSDTRSSKGILLQISDRLGIRALSRPTLYGTGRYNSMTGDVTADDALMYAERKQQEMPVSDVVRDRKISTTNNTGSGQLLKQSITKLAEDRSNYVKEKLAKLNFIYKEMLSGKLGSGIKYGNFTNDEVSALAERKVKKTDPSLYENKKKLDKDVEQQYQQISKLNDKYNTEENRISEAKRLRGKADWISQDRKRSAQKAGAIVGGGVTLGLLGKYVVDARNETTGFINSLEFTDFSNSDAVKSENRSLIRKERERYLEKYKARIKNEGERNKLTAKLLPRKKKQ